jgi:nucleotide-binding universal stress UspA family protein
MSGQEDEGDHRIVAGVDGSASSVEALRWAVRQAEQAGSTVEAVIAWQYPAAAIGFGWGAIADETDYSELAAKTVAEAISQAVDPNSHVRVRPVVMHGHPAQVLTDYAADGDLLVLGSRGHGGFAGAVLGSVSQHCTHYATCPVVVIRGRSQGLTGSPKAEKLRRNPERKTDVREAAGGH